MEYIKISKAAEKWGISARRIRVLCAEGKVPGAIRKGNLYMVVDFPTDDTWFNALRLCDGTHHEMNDDDEVQEVNVTITVTNV